MTDAHALICKMAIDAMLRDRLTAAEETEKRRRRLARILRIAEQSRRRAMIKRMIHAYNATRPWRVTCGSGGCDMRARNRYTKLPSKHGISCTEDVLPVTVYGPARDVTITTDQGFVPLTPLSGRDGATVRVNRITGDVRVCGKDGQWHKVEPA